MGEPICGYGFCPLKLAPHWLFRVGAGPHFPHLEWFPISGKSPFKVFCNHFQFSGANFCIMFVTVLDLSCTPQKRVLLKKYHKPFCFPGKWLTIENHLALPDSKIRPTFIFLSDSDKTSPSFFVIPIRHVNDFVAYLPL